MTLPLSQRLADLSVRAKKAEDAITSTRNETRDKVVARREEFRAAAVAAADQVDDDLQSAGDAKLAVLDAVIADREAAEAQR